MAKLCRFVARFGTLLLVLSLPAASGPLSVLAAEYRPDRPFPEHCMFWHESWDPGGAAAQAEAVQRRLGGMLHVIVRNVSDAPAVLSDVLFGDVSLARAIAESEQTRKRGLHPASIEFADLPEQVKQQLLRAGEPVWWRVDPRTIAPGEAGEAVVRLRRQPQTGSLEVVLVADRGTVPLSIPVRSAPVRRLRRASVGPGGSEILVYAEMPDAGAGLRVKMDGEDVTPQATFGRSAAVDVVPILIKPELPVSPGALHAFTVGDGAGRTASAALRLFPGLPFAYGIWGSRPGKAEDAKRAEAYIRELRAHNVNVQMAMVGSAAVREFLKVEEGQQLCRELGITRMVSDPGKGRTRNPFAYFLVDEPDCGDYAVKDLPADRRVGSLAQALVGRAGRFRAKDPVTPHLLNVNLTYKPQNWYTYGQLPDIMAADPYYQSRLRDSYWKHPGRLPLYTKPTYVYAIGSVCAAACAPKPLHLLLNSVSYTKPNRKFRTATPEEKRVEAYYAIAAGATGLSYWWYTPVAPCVGCGDRDDPRARRLWREIGILGAELRTVGSLITRSCPARVETRAPKTLWVRTLLCGLDSALVLVVNDDIASDREGTVWTPVEDAVVSVRLPEWLADAAVFEVSADGVRDAEVAREGAETRFSLGKVELTRLVVVSTVPGLREQLQRRYQAEFAETVAALREEASGD